MLTDRLRGWEMEMSSVESGIERVCASQVVNEDLTGGVVSGDAGATNIAST